MADHGEASRPSTPLSTLKRRGEAPPKAKAQTKAKKFQPDWLIQAENKAWLQPVHANEYLARCKACDKTFACGSSEIKKHSEGKKHKECLKAYLSSNCIEKYTRNEEETRRLKQHKERVQTAEIKLAAFYAEHNIAISTIDHLIPLLQEVCCDPQVVTDLTLKRTKCTKIITNIVAKTEKDNLVKILKSDVFSVLFDESVDVANKKNLCILVRYASPPPTLITTQLLQLVQLDAKDGSAANLYAAFKECFTSKEIPMQHIIGLACDGPTVMVGEHNSFFSHLKADVPHVILLKCICHSSALVSSKACSELPRGPEDLLRGVCTYISGSSKRSEQLQEIQEYFGGSQNKMLKLSSTRWLCMHQCVVRVLDNWEALKAFFQIASFEDKLISADNILAGLNDECVKAYFLFLKYILNWFNSFNALFQSRDTLIHKLVECSERLFRQICQNFMSAGSLAKEDVNIIPQNYLPLEEIFLGPECESLVSAFPRNIQHDFRVKILAFYVRAANEIKARLPIKNPTFREMAFNDQNIALNSDRKNLKSLPLLFSWFHSVNGCDVSKLAVEWRNLPYFFGSDDKERLVSLSVDMFWKCVSEAKDFSSELAFALISSLARAVLAMPHSNAEAERIFSVVTDVKVKKRNRMGHVTLDAIATIRSAFQSKKLDCCTFKVCDEHLILHTADNLYGGELSDVDDILDESETDQ